MGEAARILEQAMQPFQRHVLHPKRCALLTPGDEIERCADTKSKSAGDTPIVQHSRDGFLLRRPDPEKAKPEGAVGFDKIQAGFDRTWIFDEPHRRIVVADVVQCISLLDPFGLRPASSYE